VAGWAGAAVLLCVAGAAAGIPRAHEADTTRSTPARLSVSYLLKIRNVPGLRGVADSVDRARAGGLDEANRSAVYFRVDDSTWVTHDDTTIAEIRQALDARELAAHRLQDAQGRPGLQQERRDIERRRRDLERRRRDLESQRSLLHAEIDRARRGGQELRGLRVRESALDNQIASLRLTEAGIVRSERMLARREEDAARTDPAAIAQDDRAMRRSVASIVAAMRRAIAHGRARTFEP
jgi:hypothetical protein